MSKSVTEAGNGASAGDDFPRKGRLNGLSHGMGALVSLVGIYLVNCIPFNHAIRHRFVVGGSACRFLVGYYGALNGQLI